MIEAYDSTLPYRIAFAALFFTVLGVRDWIKHPENPTRIREYLFLISAMLIAIIYGFVHDHITATISADYFLHAKGLAMDPQPFRVAVSWLAVKASYGPGVLAGALMLVANNPAPQKPQLSYAHLFRLCVYPVCSAVAMAAMGGVLGGLLARQPGVQDAALAYTSLDRVGAFVAVWGVHAGSYLGFVCGTVLVLERISKPSQHDDDTGKLNKTMKKVSVVFVPGDKASEVLQPTDRAFNSPAATVATEFATILGRRPLAGLAMRTDQIDSSAAKPRTQRVAISRSIVNQPLSLSSQDSLLEQRLDESYFVGAGACSVNSERKTMAVDEDHDLRPLSAFGLANLFTPFLAVANVPSAMDSSRHTRPWRSSFRSKRPQAFSQTPASVHFWRRRQQVVAEGNRSGRSFHLAPLRRIQMIPSTHGRDATTGRPPLGPTGVSGNRSLINCHCSSVSSYSGSVLDPSGVSTAGRDRAFMSASFRLHSLRTKQFQGLASETRF